MNSGRDDGLPGSGRGRQDNVSLSLAELLQDLEDSLNLARIRLIEWEVFLDQI